MGEIYKITNLINGKIYIGKTSRTSQKRFNEHFRDAKTRKGIRSPIHMAMIKYGKENFSFEIIEKDIPKEKLDEMEKYYIKLFDSTNSKIGYNATKGGDGGKTNKKLNDDNIKEIKEILKTTDISLSNIAKKYKVDSSVISRINIGETYKDNNEEYPIRKYSLTEIGAVDKRNIQK